jgi:hypothetical protein
MKSLIKVILLFFVAIITVLIGGGIYLSRNLPEIITRSVEEYGPKATGTAVTLDDIQIIYGTGRVALKNLVVKNPPGYKTDHAFQLGKMVFQLNPASIFDEAIVIDHFTLSDASIIAEQAGTRIRTNLQEIAEHARQQGRRTERSARRNVEQADSDAAAPVKLIVDELRLTGNSVDLVTEHWGNRQLEMPDIIFKDIGRKEGGLTPDQLTQRIIELVTQEASKVAMDELKEMAKEKARDKISTKVKNVFNSLFD